MLEIFNYSFMIRAFIAGGIIAIIAPIIGSFLVAKKYSLMADSLAHVSLAGVALGVLLGIYPVYTALLVTVTTALIIEKLRTKHGVSGEIALGMFLSGGLAIAIVLIGLVKGFNVDLFSYLFGSITTVQTTDLYVIGVLGIVILLTVLALYKELVAVSFDEETALVSGIPTTAINSVLMILTALTISVAMRIVGVLLIGALMIIPVVTAMQLKMSFQKTIIFAIIFSLLSVILGLFASYYLNIASGGAIVVVSLLIFFTTIFLKKN